MGSGWPLALKRRVDSGARAASSGLGVDAGAGVATGGAGGALSHLEREPKQNANLDF